MTYEFYINDIKFNPIADVSLSKQRLDDNPLIVRFFIDGNITFFGADYDALEIYAGQQIKNYVREINEEGLTSDYEIIYSFENEINPETKFIKAKIIYYDKYTKILKDIDNSYSLKNLQKIYIFNHLANDNSGATRPYIQFEEQYNNCYLLVDIIEYLVQKIDDTILFDSSSFAALEGVFDLALAKINPNINETIYNHVSILNFYDKDNMTEEDNELYSQMQAQDTIEISLGEIMDFLKNLSFYWYIDKFNYFRIAKDFSFNPNTLDLTEFSNISNSLITLLPKANKTVLKQNEPENCSDLFKSINISYDYFIDNSFDRIIPFGTDLLKNIIDYNNSDKYINNQKAKDLNIFAVTKTDLASFCMNNSLNFTDIFYKSDSAINEISSTSFWGYGEIIKPTSYLRIFPQANGFIFDEYIGINPENFVCSRFIHAEKNQVFKIKLDKYFVNSADYLRFGYGYVSEIGSDINISKKIIDIDTEAEFEITIDVLNEETNQIYFYFKTDYAFDPLDNYIYCRIFTDNSYFVNEQDGVGELKINTNYQLSFNWLLENNQINNMPFASGTDINNDETINFEVMNNAKKSMIIRTNLLFSQINENDKILVNGEEYRIEKYTRNITKSTKKDENIIISKKYV